jgi:hypothetical protein
MAAILSVLSFYIVTEIFKDNKNVTAFEPFAIRQISN